MGLQHYYPWSLGLKSSQLPGEYTACATKYVAQSRLINHKNQLCPHRYPFTPGWREAIIVKCLAQGHKCHDRDSNPHSTEQNPQSLNSVLLSAQPWHPKVDSVGRVAACKEVVGSYPTLVNFSLFSPKLKIKNTAFWTLVIFWVQKERNLLFRPFWKEHVYRKKYERFFVLSLPNILLVYFIGL